jgi:hypothetical protein
MPKLESHDILDAIRKAAKDLGRPPSRPEFTARSGLSEYKVLNHFPSWREAVRAAGLTPDSTNVRLDDESLLKDWGELVRRSRRIPTRDQYRREGNYSPGAFEKHFGPWSAIPAKFRDFARNKPEWGQMLCRCSPCRFSSEYRLPVTLQLLLSLQITPRPLPSHSTGIRSSMVDRPMGTQ